MHDDKKNDELNNEQNSKDKNKKNEIFKYIYDAYIKYFEMDDNIFNFDDILTQFNSNAKNVDFYEFILNYIYIKICQYGK